MINSETIKSNSYGGKSWVAEITGTDPKFTFSRSFCGKRDVTDRKSNTYRTLEIEVALTEGTVYEYRDLDNTSGGGMSGFWQVQGGKLAEITKAVAKGIVETRAKL